MPSARSPRSTHPKKRRNVLREAGVEGPVDYKDVVLLRRFLTEKGKIRSRRVTGLSPQEQRQVTRAIKIAREVALLPYVGRGA